MAIARQLRDEAAVCRQLAREIKDPQSIDMMLDRARQLEAQATEIEGRDAAAAAAKRPSRAGDRLVLTRRPG